MIPLQTGTENTSANRDPHTQKEPPPDLFPQELSQRGHVRSMNAQAEQANEHDEKQDDISNEGTGGAKCDDRDVAWQAVIRSRSP
jgi:hypothetical protein